MTSFWLNRLGKSRPPAHSPAASERHFAPCSGRTGRKDAALPSVVLPRRAAPEAPCGFPWWGSASYGLRGPVGGAACSWDALQSAGGRGRELALSLPTAELTDCAARACPSRDVEIILTRSGNHSEQDRKLCFRHCIVSPPSGMRSPGAPLYRAVIAAA